MIDWLTHNLTGLGQLLATAGTVIGVIGGLWIKSKRNDNSMQKYIIDTVRKENQEANLEIKQVKQEYQEFQKLHEATVRKLNEQIGLKEEENQQLRAKNRLLKAENDAYHAKYGGIDYQ
ncbi:hypothetical protein EFO90_16560 [Lactiplantibacillus plantarum]|uniref:hypothetical protein n=1 Tax=Lactiplantibacillus plantarum TaxID=1590 RepID=UPI0021823D5A|nr:hypothetical protein [Lactiplantibacillus plantarum]MCS8622960.1 hypothetical protein [Lactiplantibacillus plantarum]MCT3215942.1 hypothetical protein [Lactiplantibacillus plantarum]MCT3271908.1 hypothetical protein [Lactiplantibacillus plantarum]